VNTIVVVVVMPVVIPNSAAVAASASQTPSGMVRFFFSLVLFSLAWRKKDQQRKREHLRL